MVVNTFIKCQVCGCVTRIRLQVGWQEEHPIIVTCGKCGTSLTGKVHINQDNLSLKFEFENADEVDNELADYMVECSGEFPTLKQCNAKDAESAVMTPFIRVAGCMKDEAIENFSKTMFQLRITASKWKDCRRIINLFQNDSEYLVQEMKKEFSGEYFQCRDEIETLRAVHMIEVNGFYSTLGKEILNNLSFSSDILKLDIVQLKTLVDYLNSNDGYHLDELQAIIYKLYDEFVEIYQYLIPALVLQYCKDDAFNFESDGSTTSTFDNVKQFYLDVYETLGTLMIIPVALNNIKYRLDVNAMNPIEGKVTSLDDFIRQTKATRYHLCIEKEIYSGFLNIVFNAKLRNAIGHNDAEYNSISQMITYIPDSKDRTKKQTEYLLEFENEAICMFQSILGISEYLYRLREISLIFAG